MKKNHIIVVVFLCFFMRSLTVVACGSTSSKKCEHKEISAKQTKNGCCDTNPNNKQQKECNGKCGHPTCNVPSVQIAIVVLSTIQLNHKGILVSVKKEKFYDRKFNVTSGFFYIWLPPNIG
jgi:hypothetical protein